LKQEYSFNGRKGEFKSYLSVTRSQVESELAKFVVRLSELTLHPQIEYAVLSRGKRLRPVLVILSAESVGGRRTDVMRLALAFELMHTASLVHDDIIDQDEDRRSKPAIHRRWSVNEAILAGDALIALSVDLASSYGEIILRAVARSALELCVGEHMDIAPTTPVLANEEWYFKKIGKKSASLFATATYCGALAGGGTSAEADALHAFGENFGLAYQIRDDLLDLEPHGDKVSRDLKTGRINLALVHFYANSNSEEQNHLETSLRRLINREQRSASSAKDVARILGKKGSLDYCAKKVDQYLSQAVLSLSVLQDSPYKDYLIGMTRALKNWG